MIRFHPPDAYNCLTSWKAKAVINNVSQKHVDSFANGTNQTCSPTEAKGKVIRMSNGTSYYIGTNLVRHWIPNGGTYNCLIYLRGKSLINNMTSTHVDSFASGSNQTCKALLVGPDGTAFYVDSTGYRHWVPNGGIFVCLEEQNVPVYRYSNWTTINRFVEDKSHWAKCNPIRDRFNRLPHVGQMSTLRGQDDLYEGPQNV